MIKFFEYNWQVRDEWFDWCNQVTIEELLKDRKGGVGNILYTLFHIIDVEYSWIRGIQGKEDVVFQFADYNTLEKVKSLSDQLRIELAEFLKTDLSDLKERIVSVPWDEAKYNVNDILHHIIAHEIHHIGQLSVWARELELQPVSANLVGRDLKSVHFY
ncbi:DinB family protein [Mesobacillus subterraneus]|uniref:DinB family protein n=1 Tax=Mesobacillus subterraneus TaxID=285983 RepID=UPI00203D98B8|nr:DinB family protein [Mesobacillus subterraneus]MCM3572331.1 DinB family protein [Mesobacillus subterraneus]